MKRITGYKKISGLGRESNQDWVNELNLLFNRSDGEASAHPPPCSPTDSFPQTPWSTSSALSLSCLTIKSEQVWKELSRLRPGKATGPNGVSTREGTQGVCQPVVQSTPAHLQPEPESGEGSCDVEDTLPSSCTKEDAPQLLQ